MFATATVLCYVLWRYAPPYNSPNNAYMVLPLQCITTAMYAL
jgi:hypothetical protein